MTHGTIKLALAAAFTSWANVSVARLAVVAHISRQIFVVVLHDVLSGAVAPFGLFTLNSPNQFAFHDGKQNCFSNVQGLTGTFHIVVKHQFLGI